MKRPTRNRDRGPRQQPAQERPEQPVADHSEKETQPMSTPTDTAEQTQGSTETAAAEPKRPKVQTTILPEMNDKWEAYCKEHNLTANIALRKLIADAVDFDLPGSELVVITRQKYESEEARKAAERERRKAKDAEMKAALDLYRKMKAAGEV